MQKLVRALFPGLMSGGACLLLLIKSLWRTFLKHPKQLWNTFQPKNY